MGLVRNAWMAAMVKRDDRVIDAILIGHLIHSVTFFASTTMLLVAALVGILAALTKPSMLSWGAWARRRPARRHNYIAAATR